MKYQLVFSGEILEVADLGMVKMNVGRVFNLKEQQVEALFSGKRVIIKKNIERAAAEQLEARMKRCGAVCTIEEMAAEAASPAAAQTPADSPAPPPPAATVDEATVWQPTAAAESPPAPDMPVPTGTLTLAPHGSDLGVAGAAVEEYEFDITAYSLDEPGVYLVEHVEIEAPVIDTGDLDLGEPGEILTEPVEVPPADIDTAGLDMDEPGVTLVEPTTIPEPEIDVSSYSVAEPGAELSRPKEAPPANIDTGTLSMED